MAVPPFKVKAVYDYSSPHEDDLNFPVGQVITVTDREDDDWYIGEYTDASGNPHSGLFPKNFVEDYQPPVPSRPARAARPATDVRSPPPPAPLSVPAPETNQDQDYSEIADEEDAATSQSRHLPEPILPPASTPFSPPAQQEQPRASSPPAALQASDRQSAAAAAVATPPKPAPVSAAATPPKPVPATAPASSSAAATPKKAPPPVSEKPSSFKDRIAAFNKPAAAPVTPFKPSAGQPSFIKKPFVAPPPSSNAYVPPPRIDPVQTIYRRDEDPEIKEKEQQDRADAERAGLIPQDKIIAPTAAEGEEEQDAPKPQSLKERIAMLQKQQMEQAARRADATQKEKPKKPAKKLPADESMADVSAPPPVPAARLADDDGDDETEPTQRASIDGPLRRVPTSSTIPPVPSSRTGTGLEDLHSEADNADMSAADEMTAEENEADDDPTSTRQSLDQSRPMRPPVDLPRAPDAPRRQPDVGDEEDAVDEGKTGDIQEDADEEDEEEEDEMDAETRRRMELRERMAKMSGGMGMAGMFGPPGGMPMPGAKPPQRKKSTNKSNRSTASDQPSSPAVSAPPIPMIPIPGMQTVRSPEPQVEKENEAEFPITSEREPQEMPDMEDITTAPSPRVSLDRAALPIPQDRPPMETSLERAVPPPVPAERPAPPPQDTRALPPRPPVAAPQQSDSEGSVSDDEMSSRATAIPSPIAPPTRPADQRSPPVPVGRQPSYFSDEVTSPASPTPQTVSEKRLSRAVPPIPGMAPNMARAPPPPPPTAEPPAQAPPVPKAPVKGLAQEESEYEGDYDTDIASGVKHKDALKSHNKDISESTFTDESMPLSPPPVPVVTAPRAVPPPPPPQITTQIPTGRMSIDAPRVAPPPPPPARNFDQEEDDDEDESDIPDRALPIRSVPPPPPSAPAPMPAALDRQDSSDDLYSTSPPRRSIDRAPPPPPPHAAPMQADRGMPPTPSTQMSAPSFSPSSRQPVRQSMDVPRTSMSAKRSMDQPRGNDGYIATDVDLGENTQWWAQPDLPPPIFQNRTDVLVEVEESQSSKRGGKTTISKDVYILFIDYSQTVITARFDARDPMDVVFEQRHEPPPQRLRQDQLENYWQLYGARMADAAATKKDSVVGDGSPRTLILDLMSPYRDALLPVGTRAYGAMIYANIANASVQQFDEIRAGDIITLRNARFQGKHGTMHQKYAMDVGMIAPSGRSGAMTQEHVAVVADWDGTKKKIRAWEQGREKTKVRMESFRLGDLKSGEVRVWRVVGRQWVGWETGQ